MFVMIAVFFLLAGLLFLVSNTGDQLNRRVQVQGAADSAALTGATWMARGLNTISFCNVTNTQLLSLIVLLDTLETVVPPSMECIDDLTENIGSSAAGHDIPLDDRTCTWLAVGNAAAEKEVISRLWDIVQAIPMDEYLSYDDGVLWECIKLLDGFEQAMLRVTPLVAQREAMEVAKKNGADFGFVLPLWPELPAERGSFSDFRDPMERGRLPSSSDRAGGYALMGYYNYRGQPTGPWNYWREPFTRTEPMGLLDLSRFSVLFNVVSQAKLDMLFGGADDRVSLRAWEMDYDKAKDLDSGRIRRVWWERMSFDCRYPFPGSSFFSNASLRNPEVPTISLRTYSDMESPDLSGWTRASESYEGADPRLAVWYRVQERKAPFYPQLGIYAEHPPIHPDGSPWPYTEAEMQTFYHVTLMRFDGAELEDDTTLHRRYLPPLGSTPPFAPILLTASGDKDPYANVLAHFTLTAFAHRPADATDWTGRFVNPNPVGKTLAYAEARVYSGRSSDGWNTFTQDWRAKLHCQERWTDLLAELHRGLPSEAESLQAEFTDERLQPVEKLLGAYEEDFVKEVSH